MSDLPDWCGLVIAGVIAVCVFAYAISSLRYANHTIKRCKQVQNEWRKTDFHVGDVVQTIDGLDRGLVTKVNENNLPSEVMASPGGPNYIETRHYGGVNSIGWYKTGERMTQSEWYKLYSTKDGWQRYCEDLQNQIKLDG